EGAWVRQPAPLRHFWPAPVLVRVQSVQVPFPCRSRALSGAAPPGRPRCRTLTCAACSSSSADFHGVFGVFAALLSVRCRGSRTTQRSVSAEPTTQRSVSGEPYNSAFGAGGQAG